jgi:hypothetical protein
MTVANPSERAIYLQWIWTNNDINKNLFLIRSHNKDHLEFCLTLVVLKPDPFGNYRLLVCILFGDIIQSFLEVTHPQTLMPMPKINLKLFDMVHHLEKALDEGLHLRVEFFRLTLEQLLFCVFPLLKSEDFSIEVLILLLDFAQIFLFYTQNFQSILATHLKPQELLRVLFLVIPRRHLKSKSLVVYLGKSGIFQ